MTLFLAILTGSPSPPPPGGWALTWLSKTPVAGPHMTDFLQSPRGVLVNFQTWLFGQGILILSVAAFRPTLPPSLVVSSLSLDPQKD